MATVRVSSARLLCLSISRTVRVSFCILLAWILTAAGSANQTFQVGKDLSDPGETVKLSVVAHDAQALQRAIQACSGKPRCLIDARNSSIGTQIFTVNPFANLNIPITIYTGAYTVQWDVNDDNALTVDLPSDLTWVLNGTTMQPTMSDVAIPQSAFLKDTAGRNANDGGSGQGMLNTRVYGLNGSIAADTNILTVSDTSKLRAGMAIAVLGGAGAMVGQETVLDGGITATATELRIATVAGFPKQGSSNSTIPDYNYVIVDNEIIGWNGVNGNSLLNLARGQFGTASTNHNDRATVSALGTLVTDIVDIKNSHVTLLDKSSLTLAATQVQAGAANISIRGSGNIRGNYLDRTSAPRGNVAVSGVFCYVCSSMTIGKDIRFTNLQHAGVFVAGGRHNFISGRYQHVGRPAAYGSGLGADVILFENASKNTVRSTTHSDGNIMVLIDDRSSGFNRLSGTSNGNDVIAGRQEGLPKYNSGVGVEGYSSNNSVTVGQLAVTGTFSNAGLYVDATSQWPSAVPVPRGSHFTFTAISSAGAAIRTANYSSSTSSNSFHGGIVLSGSAKFASPSDGFRVDKKKRGP